PSLTVCAPACSSPEPAPLSLHDALPIFELRTTLRDRYALLPYRQAALRIQSNDLTAGKTCHRQLIGQQGCAGAPQGQYGRGAFVDRKSTRLNSSHVKISYAVFCLKKKNI